MVGINLFGFRKFELLRGGDGGGEGGGGGPGGDDGTGATDAGNQGGLSAGTSGGVDGDLGEFGGSGPDVSAQGNVGSFDPGFAPDAQFSDEDVGAGVPSSTMGVSPGQALAQVGITSFGDIADGTNVDVAGMTPASLDFATELGIGTAPGSAQAVEDALAQDASISFSDDDAVNVGISGMLGTAPVSPEAATVDPSQVTDISFNQSAFDQMMGGGATGTNTYNANQTGIPEINAMVAPFKSSSGYPSIDNLATINQGIIDDNANTSGVTSDTLYGTSPSVIDPVTGLPQQVTAMSPAKAAAMTGGIPGTMTGMNLAQDQNSLEASKQAAAMDVLGAQIGAGNLTGNEDIDEVNQELAKQGVQIDSGLPGLLGTGVNAFNQNYQLNKNQDILSQLAQGSNVPDTGILGTGIGAVKGVNTYKPAYNAQGQIVGSVATDAAGNAVGGPAGITTNVVGGINAMPELYSDAAGTKLYTGANQAVGDFQEMAAASKSSEEGPPEDVTSVDANGCVIGAEFFDGQKCSPIGSTGTGDATGGGTGGAFTPYNYQPGQGTMLRPDFSDAFTSSVGSSSSTAPIEDIIPSSLIIKVSPSINL